MIAALVLAAGLTAAPVRPAIQDSREKPREVAAIESCAKQNADRLAEMDARVATEEATLANAETRLRSWRIPSTRTADAQWRRETQLSADVDIARARLQAMNAARDALRAQDRCS